MSKIKMKKGRKKRYLKRMYLMNPGLKMFLKNLDVRRKKLIPPQFGKRMFSDLYSPVDQEDPVVKKQKFEMSEILSSAV